MIICKIISILPDHKTYKKYLIAINLHNKKHFLYIRNDFEMKIYNADNKIYYLSSESRFFSETKAH